MILHGSGGLEGYLLFVRLTFWLDRFQTRAGMLDLIKSYTITKGPPSVLKDKKCLRLTQSVLADVPDETMLHCYAAPAAQGCTISKRHKLRPYTINWSSFTPDSRYMRRASA